MRGLSWNSRIAITLDSVYAAMQPRLVAPTWHPLRTKAIRNTHAKRRSTSSPSRCSRNRLGPRTLGSSLCCEKQTSATTTRKRAICSINLPRTEWAPFAFAAACSDGSWHDQGVRFTGRAVQRSVLLNQARSDTRLYVTALRAAGDRYTMGRRGSMNSIAGQDCFVRALGIWRPDYIAYIRELRYLGTDGNQGEVEIRCLAQERSRNANWPDLEQAFWEVRIRFRGVRNLSLVSDTSGDIQVMGLAIDDVSDRQLEGIGVEVSDVEDGVIAFVAAAAVVESCEPSRDSPRAWPLKCMGPGPAPGGD